MNQRKNLLPGIFIVILTALAGTVFLLSVHQTRMVPAPYMAALGVLLLAVTTGVFLLVKNRQKLRRFLGGVCLASVLMGLYAAGMSAIYDFTTTIEHIINVTPEVSEIKIYVAAGDPAQSINDAAAYTYGILLLQDRENTDKALEEVNRQLQEETGEDMELSYLEYDGVTELIDGLERGEVGAIVLNTAFLVLLEEQEGYADIASRLREISVQHIEAPPSSVPEQTEPPKLDKDVYTIFISGIDTRSNTLNIKSRSDVNIIATINIKTHEVLLLTTPRDYFVPLSISHGQPDKLTHAGLYGVNVCIDTLEMLYDIDIDYYFRVNFTGFVDIIDALGGVEVYNPKEFKRNGQTFVKGMNHVDGNRALIFARERYSYIDGDLQRGRNQIALVEAVIKKMTTSTAILTNFSSLMKSMEGSFETTIPYEVIAGIVSNQLATMPSWKIHTYGVTGTSASRIPYSMSTKQFVWLPHTSSVKLAQQKMQTIRDGGTLDTSSQ
ncbi:MAG: LCP family protein [Clostridia bacterium]|nr:LCP family protein [Clostridia bacterium]